MDFFGCSSVAERVIGGDVDQDLLEIPVVGCEGFERRGGYYITRTLEPECHPFEFRRPREVNRTRWVQCTYLRNKLGCEA